MPEVIVEINRDHHVCMRDRVILGHNRWHTDIRPAATLRTRST